MIDKHRVLIIFFVITLILASCGPKSEIPESSDVPEFLRPRTPSSPLTVVIMIGGPVPYLERIETTELDYFAQERRFALNFELINLRPDGQHGPDGRLSDETIYTYIDARRDENVLFIVPYDTAVELYGRIPMANLREDAASWLPAAAYNNALHFNGGNALHLLPTAMLHPVVRYPTVGIRSEDYTLFGHEIHSVDNYSDFLYWAQNRGSAAASWSLFVPSLIPGIAELDAYAHTILPLDLFMPGMGYTSIRGMFLGHIGSDMINHLWMDRGGRAAAWYELDSAAMAFSYYMNWQRDGLIEFFPARWRVLADGKISLSIPPPDIIGFNSTLNGYLSFDFPTLSIDRVNERQSDFIYMNLHEPALAIPHISYAAFAFPGVDASEFLQFYDYLWQSPEDYALYRHGTSDKELWGTLSGLSYRMVISMQHHAWYLYPDSIAPDPIDFTTLYPLTAQQMHEVGATLRRCPDYNAFIDSMNAYLFHYFHYLYTDPENAIPFYRVMADIRAMPGSDIATRLVNEALGR